MKKYLSFLLLPALLLTLTACPDHDTVETILTVSPSSITLSADGEDSGYIIVTCNETWSVNSSESWLNCSQPSGNGDAEIEVYADENTDAKKRTATLTFQAGDLTRTVRVTQEAGKETEKPEEPSLTVSPTEISLLPQANSSSTISIQSNNTWTATCNADWINLSSRSGNGNTTITITALTANTSSSERSTNITIKSGSISEIVSVSQLPGQANASVSFNTSNMVKLTTSIAFELNYSGDIDYFYAGYLKKSESAGWTDEKIAKTLSEEFEASSPEDINILAIGDLEPNTSYYLCAVAYDAKGKQGSVTKVEVTTAKTDRQRPSVDITNVSYTSSTWEWETIMGPYTSRYYMIAQGGDNAMVFILLEPAYVAFLMKEQIAEGKLKPITQNSAWQLSRNSTDMSFYCACWAQNDEKKWASDLDEFGGSISSDANIRKATNIRKTTNSNKPKVSGYKKSDAQRMHLNIHEVVK